MDRELLEALRLLVKSIQSLPEHRYDSRLDTSVGFAVNVLEYYDKNNASNKNQLYQCPFNKATKCDMQLPCLGCKEFIPIKN